MSAVAKAKAKVKAKLDSCRVCGCTEMEPCNPPCTWTEVDLCSTCFVAIEGLRIWKESIENADVKALIREAFGT